MKNYKRQENKNNYISIIFSVFVFVSLLLPGLAETYYLNNIGNIGIYFTGIFIKNIYLCKVLKLSIQCKHLH